MKKRKFWERSEIDVLLENYLLMPYREIGFKLGRSTVAVKIKAQKIGLHKLWRFTPAQVDELKRIYPTTSTRELADKFGCSIHTVVNVAHWLKLRKTDEHIKKSGKRFKKGNFPKNKLPVGTEKINSEGYRKVKIAEPNVWTEKHRIIWIEANGEIPSGFRVAFKDGNSKNCVLENLELISMRNIMLRNSIHNYPPELKETIRTLGVLKREIKSRRQINRGENYAEK